MHNSLHLDCNYTDSFDMEMDHKDFQDVFDKVTLFDCKLGNFLMAGRKQNLLEYGFEPSFRRSPEMYLY